MKKNLPPSPDARVLRQRAEQKLRQHQQVPARPLSEIDARALVHELQVHQLELEMQNEELRRAQVEAGQAAEKYAELFDFAPVGFFALDRHGVVRAVNLAGAALLGLDRLRVSGQPFEQYVVPDCRAAFSDFCRSVRPGEGRRACDTRLLKHGHGPCDVLVEASAPEDESGEDYGCRLAVTDITERKRAEEKLQRINAELEQRSAELGASNEELTLFNRLMVDRELRMVELKEEVNQLCRQAGQPPRYPGPSGPEQPMPEAQSKSATSGKAGGSP